MKIHQQGVKIFNKTFNFELSIGLLPSILIISSKEFLLKKYLENLINRAKIFNKTFSFAVSIGLLPIISFVSSKESVTERKILSYSFEVKISLLKSINPCYRSIIKTQSTRIDILTKHAVLKLGLLYFDCLIKSSKRTHYPSEIFNKSFV